MPVDIKKTRSTFSKVERQLPKLRKNTTPDNVHKFRTASRRAELLLSEVVPAMNRNDRKLLKLLAFLRKKAGKVRDLDVQIAALGSLKISGGNGDKTRLMEFLVDERVKNEKKLAKTADRKTEHEIQERLSRAVKELDRVKDAVPLALALSLLAQLGRDHAPLTEKNLHQYRIVGKHARYLAELESRNPQAKQLIKKLKPLQDVIGDWHDWLKMTQAAEQLLGGPRDSALVAMLQNLTRAKYRQALDAVAETRATLSKPIAVTPAPAGKPVGREHSRTASAA